MADLKNIGIEFLHPHPYNPRKDLGDISELAESIKAKGVLQNLTVVSMVLVDPDATITLGDGHYTILIGHRRFAAAKLAGLTELPCAVVEMDEKEQLQTMLIENMQRSDLTVYEQAQGFQMMLNLGSTVEEIAEKSGFSTTTVRRRVKMMELDQEKLKEVSCRQLSLEDFDTLAQIEDIEERNECLEQIGTNNFNNYVSSAMRRQNEKKNLPAVKKYLEQIDAKEIPDKDVYSSKYEMYKSSVNICNWEKEKGNYPQTVEEQIFYSIRYGSLYLYKKAKKAPPVKKPPEAIEKEKAIRQAWEELESIASTTYALRKQFVEKLTVTQANRAFIYHGAMLTGALDAVEYSSPDREAVRRILGLEGMYSTDRTEKFLEKIGFVEERNVPELIYALFGDEEKEVCSFHNKCLFPEFKISAKLSLVYQWLNSLGYEMSTEEVELLTGEHEVYSRGKAYERQTV